MVKHLNRHGTKWLYIMVLCLIMLIYPLRANAVGMVTAYQEYTSFAFTPPVLTYHTGFEANNLSAEGLTNSGSPAIITSTKNTGSYGLQCSTSGTGKYITAGAANIKSFSFYMNIASSGTPSAETAIAGSTSTLLRLTLTTTRYLKFYDASNNLGGTSTYALSEGAWYRISYSSGTTTHAIYINGIKDFDITSGYGFMAPNFGVINNVTANIYFDDFAMNVTASDIEVGDIRSLQALPNAAGDSTGYTKSGVQATNWQSVSEFPGSDSNYVSASSATDLYNITNSSTLSISNVVALNLLYRQKISNTSSQNSSIQVKDNGSTTNYANTLTTSAAWYQKYLATMPNGGAAWTDARFDAFQVGQTVSNRTHTVYEIYIEVAYAVIPGNPSGLASPSQTSVSIDLTWTKGSQADQTLIRYRSDGTYPTSTSDGTQGYLGTGSSTTLGSLSPSTTYKIRAWAYSSPLGLYSSGTSDLTQATPAGYDISNSPSSKDFGVVATSATLYAKGSAPSNPVVDADCTFTITNNGSGAIKINIKATNFTGGVGWTLGAPGANTARMTAYYSGENPASGVVLTTSDQQFYASLAASGTLKWDFKLETPTSTTDGAQKSSTITLTATAP